MIVIFTFIVCEGSQIGAHLDIQQPPALPMAVVESSDPAAEEKMKAAANRYYTFAGKPPMVPPMVVLTDTASSREDAESKTSAAGSARGLEWAILDILEHGKLGYRDLGTRPVAKQDAPKKAAPTTEAYTPQAISGQEAEQQDANLSRRASIEKELKEKGVSMGDVDRELGKSQGYTRNYVRGRNRLSEKKYAEILRGIEAAEGHKGDSLEPPNKDLRVLIESSGFTYQAIGKQIGWSSGTVSRKLEDPNLSVSDKAMVRAAVDALKAAKTPKPRNHAVREFIAETGLTQWEVAMEMKMSRSRFGVMMGRALTEQETSAIIDAVDALSGGKSNAK